MLFESIETASRVRAPFRKSPTTQHCTNAQPLVSPLSFAAVCSVASADIAFETGGSMTQHEQIDLETEEESKPLTPFQLFLAKLAAVTVAAVLFLFAATLILENFITSNAEKFAFLKGGPAFWATAELKLYALADERDLPPEKKARIIAALKKITERYRPYLDAAGLSPKVGANP
jgi:hypothetical protein